MLIPGASSRSLVWMQDAPPRTLASATAVNSAAGHHMIAGEPRVLAAALRAGERSWAAWTYYQRRYGDRGRQFTRSDSGWLATLPGLSAAAVEHQVRWLGALLAARGMPRLLLEEHLVVLHDELRTAIPERAGDYVSLLTAASALRREREQWMPDARLARLESDFRTLLGPAVPDELRAGALIAAAVADEKSKVPGAVESLLEWLADATRFPHEWLRAVEMTLRRSRHAAARRKRTSS